MSRMYQVNFKLYNNIHNDDRRGGLLCREIAPPNKSIADLSNGFWVTENGEFVDRMCELGDTFIPPHKILSIEVIQ